MNFLDNLAELAMRLTDRVAARVQADERGTVTEFLVLAVMAIIVVLAMIGPFKSLTGKVITYIGDQLGV